MQEKSIHFVYLTTNLINGKQYVGDHSTNNLDDDYLGSGHALLKSIKKHGNLQFKREILEIFDAREDTFNAQEKYINKYNTLVPSGYNISPKGGLGIKGCHSEETKQRMKKLRSEVTKQKMRKPKSEKTKQKIKNTLTDIRHSEERKEHMRKPRTLTPKMIEAFKRNKGRKATEKTRKKQSESLKGKKRSEKTKENMKAGWVKRKESALIYIHSIF